MLEIYNSSNFTENNTISEGIYFHGDIQAILGSDKAYLPFKSVIKKNVEMIEYTDVNKDGIYKAFTEFNGERYELVFYYWKIKQLFSVITYHKGLIVLKKDKEANKSAKSKFNRKSINL